MSKLKPCPFCGGEPIALYGDSGWPYIACTNCKAAIGTVGYFDVLTEEELIVAWNIRVPREDVEHGVD